MRYNNSFIYENDNLSIDLTNTSTNGSAFPQYFVFGVEVAVPPWEAFATAIILILVILTTVIGNILVILSVFNYRPLRIAQNFFIVSLAVADLTVAILVLPFNLANYITNKWIFGIYVCKMWLTSDVLCCTASILNLCAIALDRYRAITDPINYARKRTVKRVTLMIAITWVLSAIISSPPLIGWNDWPDVFDVDTPCRLTSEKGYVIYSSFGSFFIPLLIMTIVYVQIFIATRRRLRERARASKLNAVKEILSNKKEHVQHSPLEPESISSDLTNCVQNNSFRTKTKPRKGKKRCKHKTKCSQHSLLVPKTQADESLSDVPSISPGKGNSSEGNEVTIEGNNNPEKSEEEKLPNKENASQTETSFIVKSTNPQKKSVFVHQFIEEKQRISLSKERKAARTLGIIMGVFVFCWLPFFLMYVILPFCSSCELSRRTINIITLLGYINSALNPIIYTIFNMDFRKAFKKLLRLRTVS